MKPFLDSDFLLQTETAKKLYHEHAAKMPIIDYHCHLIPQQIADNYQFADLTEIWLGGDHYQNQYLSPLTTKVIGITGMPILVTIGRQYINILL